MNNIISKLFPLLLLLFLTPPGYASQPAPVDGVQPDISAAEPLQKLMYKGKIVGKSNKAKQISMAVGAGADIRNIMLTFDDSTKGVEHAVKGHGAIVHYEMRNGKPFATLVKAKLAALPAGSTEIDVAGVNQLINANSNFVLIDSRPGQRYAESHLPTAISIPVCSMQELIDLLPKDKDQLLVFYCGGRT
ncbi:MAG: rhodanese-like domain-containing protein [Desulfobulbaceae bacterium]|jgi:predicted sulfurtransferase|nr:rhodanese-like domain-containing protein [Desulfobulbaceae bacterium]